MQPTPPPSSPPDLERRQTGAMLLFLGVLGGTIVILDLVVGTSMTSVSVVQKAGYVLMSVSLVLLGMRMRTRPPSRRLWVTYLIVAFGSIACLTVSLVLEYLR